MPELMWFGADPEIGPVVKSTGQWRPVTRFFRDHDRIFAIGLDGERDTASLEFRPGVQTSADVVVDTMADLFEKLVEFYHPPAIAYRAGAWIDPEPLGGHIHISWDPYANPVREEDVKECLRALNSACYRLTNEWFPPEQLRLRHRYAIQHQKDYAKLSAVRPRTLLDCVQQNHLEYRYPPSWMLTPEMAYTFLGTAEALARLTLVNKEKRTTWRDVVNNILKHDAHLPLGNPSIAEAYKIAGKYLNWETDIADAWTA